MTPNALTPAEFAGAWQARLLACKRRQKKAARPGVKEHVDGGH